MIRLVLALAAAASQEPAPQKSEPASEPGFHYLPHWRLFEPLLADPRWPRFSACYQRWVDDPVLKNVGSVSFGEFFGLIGYEAGETGRFEGGVQAGVFAVFDLDAESFDLVNADYWIGLPLSWRLGPFSAILRAFHQSSHLGDEFLLRRSVDRVNLSYESIDFKMSYDADPFRLYAGAGYLVHTEPERIDPGSVQAGVEFEASTDWFSGRVRPVAAVDLQRHQESGSTFDLAVRAGLKVADPVQGRTVMFLLEYYSGRNPHGQFFDREIDYYGVGVHVFF